jgi:NhaA family Na+:H+ antiporter
VTRRSRRPASLLREFFEHNTSGGIVLLAAALLAVAWSNSPWAASYEALWGTKLGASLGEGSFTLSLRHWINDALMAVFFLYVGLEIKRELLVGELAGLRSAALPAAAAVGGAVLPAAIFVAVTGPGSADFRGWGIPMATDIAFVLGVLALLGGRIPLAIRIFVTALAIVDDLLAVVVIAVFYTAELSIAHVAAAVLCFILLVGANWFGIRRPLAYAVLGVALWVAVIGSGIHATVAGVLLAMTIPARGRVSRHEFVRRARSAMNELTEFGDRDAHGRQEKLAEIRSAARDAQAPMIAIEHGLSRWVAFLIVPLFALANAGVAINIDMATLASDTLVVGIVLGLIVGKLLGITGAAFLAVRSGLAELPPGVTWAQLAGAALLCGIGFTMSLFVAELAYGGSDTLDRAKLGILVASILAGTTGYLALRLVSRRKAQTVSTSAD